MAYSFKTLHSSSTPQALHVGYFEDLAFLIVKHSSLEVYTGDLDLQCILIQPLFATIRASSVMTYGSVSRLAVLPT